MSKQRTHRQETKQQPVTPTVQRLPNQVESVQLAESADVSEEIPANHDDLLDQLEQLQKTVARAEEYIALLEEENKMLRTDNMPGGSEETAKPVIFVPQVRMVEQPHAVKVFRGTDLGPQNRDVVNIKERAKHILNVTFADNCVYEISFENGRAKVPQKIADYVHAENPGNCMRTV